MDGERVGSLCTDEVILASAGSSAGSAMMGPVFWRKKRAKKAMSNERRHMRANDANSSVVPSMGSLSVEKVLAATADASISTFPGVRGIS